MIDEATSAFLSDFLRRTAIRERAEIVAIAILQTHVHVLVRSGPKIDLSRLVQLMKGGSSYAGSRLAGNRFGLRWAREYPAEGGRIPRDPGSASPGRGDPTLKRGLGQHSATARCQMSFRTVRAEPML